MACLGLLCRPALVAFSCGRGQLASLPRAPTLPIAVGSGVSGSRLTNCGTGGGRRPLPCPCFGFRVVGPAPLDGDRRARAAVAGLVAESERTTQYPSRFVRFCCAHHRGGCEDSEVGLCLRSRRWQLHCRLHSNGNMNQGFLLAHLEKRHLDECSSTCMENCLAVCSRATTARNTRGLPLFSYPAPSQPEGAKFDAEPVRQRPTANGRSGR